MRPAEGATKPARRAPLAVEAPGPDRPAGPPPTPIPVPWEKVFAADYAGLPALPAGRQGGSQGGK
jgi:hypothetical protein